MYVQINQYYCILYTHKQKYVCHPQLVSTIFILLQVHVDTKLVPEEY